jgi:hypothetical protein
VQKLYHTPFLFTFPIAVLMSFAVVDVSAAFDFMPDIIVRESDLYDNDIVTSIEPGRTHLRLSNGTANIGLGKFYVYGVLPPNGDGTQDVMQRIFRSDGTYWDTLAGQFIYHEAHDHIHLENWAVYRLREVLPGDGVGPVVAEGEKTSFCVLDLAVYDPDLPGFDPAGEFHSCSSQIQGLSVGWIDIYSKVLPGQNIDITDVPDGEYWLESEVDPDQHFIESDKSNNITRVKVTIGQPGPLIADPYEPNNTLGAVDGRPPGGPNSPNLGPCNPERVVANLSVHESNDDDYFKFYSNDQGGITDYISILFSHSLGDLDMELIDDNLQIVGSSTSASDNETISLDGRPEGWYYIRVYGYLGATHPSYDLIVNPPSNQTPNITTVSPPVGDVVVIHGAETYDIEWTYSDPEGDEAWVSVFVNASPILDGSEYMIPTSLYTDADQSFYVLNSSYLDVGTYWVYCQITDGGSTSGDWSEGTISLVENETVGNLEGFVVNHEIEPIEGVVVSFADKHNVKDTTESDGSYHLHHIIPGIYSVVFEHSTYADTIVDNVELAAGDTTILNVEMRPDCGYVSGDADGTSEVDIDDVVYLLAYIFSGGQAPNPIESGDPDCSDSVDIDDAVYLLNYIFSGGPDPCFGCL